MRGSLVIFLLERENIQLAFKVTNPSKQRGDNEEKVIALFEN